MFNVSLGIDVGEDVIFEDVLVRLIDTAGIRLADSEIEKEGVQRAKELIDSSEIILVIIDISEEIDKEDLQIIEDLVLNQKKKLLVVANKIDKKENLGSEEYVKNLDLDTIYISAKEETNIDVLKNRVYKKIKNQNKIGFEEIIISNKRQFEILKKVKKLLVENRKSFQAKTGVEFIAADLRITIDCLSELTGEITTDDILNNIFSNFCIGK